MTYKEQIRKYKMIVMVCTHFFLCSMVKGNFQSFKTL